MFNKKLMFIFTAVVLHSCATLSYAAPYPFTMAIKNNYAPGNFDSICGVNSSTYHIDKNGTIYCNMQPLPGTNNFVVQLRADNGNVCSYTLPGGADIIVNNHLAVANILIEPNSWDASCSIYVSYK